MAFEQIAEVPFDVREEILTGGQEN